MFSQDTRSCKRNPERYENSFLRSTSDYLKNRWIYGRGSPMDHDGKKGEMIFMDKVEIDKYSPLHKTGHISKGDQRKWKIENLWYKADYMGYESLAEVLVSKLLG